MAILDVDSVQAFVTVADLQSFTRAAEALGSTQGAVSVKLKRLEERIGHKLIERTPRQVRLSARGAAFLEPARAFLAAHDRALAEVAAPARRFMIGIAAHVAGPELPNLLSHLHRHDPQLCMGVEIDTSRKLLDAFDRGALDACIIRREDDRRDGEVLAEDSFDWFAASNFDYRPDEPLRLAALAPSCGVRDTATKLLDTAGIRWHESFVGGSSAVFAAVSAGLAVAALSHRLAPAGAVAVGKRFGLPGLPPSEIVLHSALTDQASRKVLQTIATAFREYRAAA